jgi:hypothetical protein
MADFVALIWVQPSALAGNRLAPLAPEVITEPSTMLASRMTRRNAPKLIGFDKTKTIAPDFRFYYFFY